MQWVTTPKVQAEEAVYFGETPANKLACPIMDKIQKGSCAGYHANAPASYFKTIKFWKTPLAHVRQRQERLRAVPGLGDAPGRR